MNWSPKEFCFLLLFQNLFKISSSTFLHSGEDDENLGFTDENSIIEVPPAIEGDQQKERAVIASSQGSVS
jgi:hypothetical protein